VPNASRLPSRDQAPTLTAPFPNDFLNSRDGTVKADISTGREAVGLGVASGTLAGFSQFIKIITDRLKTTTKNNRRVGFESFKIDSIISSPDPGGASVSDGMCDFGMASSNAGAVG
jgi:hypothetical protein